MSECVLGSVVAEGRGETESLPTLGKSRPLNVAYNFSDSASSPVMTLEKCTSNAQCSGGASVSLSVTWKEYPSVL